MYDWNNIITNPVFSISGWVATIIGVFISFIFYYRSKKDKSPCYSISDYELIRSRQGLPLEVRYSGTKVNRLNASDIVLWNAGRESIRKIDIATHSPLQIVAGQDTQILDINIVTQSKDANHFNVAVNDVRTSALITFDYLDKNDGVRLRVLHDGAISLTGDIIGATLKNFNNQYVYFKLFKLKIPREAFSLGFSVPPAIGSTTLLFFDKSVDNNASRIIIGIILILFVSSIYFLFGGKKSVPHKLSKP